MLTPGECEEICEQSADKLRLLRSCFKNLHSVLVAFSGGVDSAFVLKIAFEELGTHAIALTAISPSVAEHEQREAVALAKQIGVTHLVVDSNELKNPSYAANPGNRCYFCKTELYGLCVHKQRELGLEAVVDGFNHDDRRDHRPGHQAAREHGIRSPLAEAQLSKKEIRAWSLKLGLPTWDKPPMPCLASRIPYGTAVTAERLKKIGAAEYSLKELGLREFRVRYHGEIARLEVSREEFSKFSDVQFAQRVNSLLREQGFMFVSLDLEPFRSGRLNDALALPSMSLPVVG